MRLPSLGRRHAARTSPAAPRPSRGRGRWRVALAILAFLVVFAWAFDWNWTRPLLRHYVMSHSGRRFEFDDLRVHLSRSLDPTIEFRGLEVENAPWAAEKRPLIRAGRFAATFAWRSLLADQKVITRMVVEDAQIDMERQADGLRNWRLSNPDDRGPPRIRLLALEARRSELHTIHRGIPLELEASIAPLPRAQAASGHPELPLTQRMRVAGTIEDRRVDGDIAVSDVLTFGATPQLFALRGTARAEGLRVAVEGVSNDAHAPGDFDLDIDARATPAAGAPTWPWPEALAQVRPLEARAHVAKAGDTWTASALRVLAGRNTTLAGELRFVGAPRDGPRRALRATLGDVTIDGDDFPALAGATKNAAAAPSPAPSAIPWNQAWLREFDADVEVRDARFTHVANDLAQSLRARATLKDGVLRVAGFDVGVAGGHVSGDLTWDASRTPGAGWVDARARSLQVARLSPRLAAGDRLSGTVDAHAVLRASGDSPRALAASLAGTLTASLSPDASVSRRLDAKLGLDGGAWLHSLFDRSGRVAVQCAALTLAIERGQGTSRSLVFETDRSALAGHASVNLVDESIDVSLTPARKTHALLALDRTIHARGPWRDVKVSLEPAGASEPQRCDAAPTTLSAR